MGGQNAAAQQQAKPVAQAVQQPPKDKMGRGGYFGAANTGPGNAGLLNTASTQRNTFLGI